MAQYSTFVFAGHGGNPYDCGAYSNGKEEHLIAEKIALKVRDYLLDAGITVQYGEDNYRKNLTQNNSYSMHYGVSIHLNAGGGTGAEAIVPMRESYCVTEQNILNDLAKLGLKNRGVKSRDYNTEKWHQRTNGVKLSGSDYYGEIRNAWGNASLTILEIGFIDNPDDLKIIENNIPQISHIIASRMAEIIDKQISPLKIENPPTSQSDAKKGYYRVICGSFSDKNNALARKEALIKSGFKEVFLEFKEK